MQDAVRTTPPCRNQVNEASCKHGCRTTKVAVGGLSMLGWDGSPWDTGIPGRDFLGSWISVLGPGRPDILTS